jgi:hypothetical protein
MVASAPTTTLPGARLTVAACPSPRSVASASTRQLGQPRPAIALADHGSQSAVKMAVACARAGVEHLCGLRLRVVPGASWRPVRRSRSSEVAPVRRRRRGVAHAPTMG